MTRRAKYTASAEEPAPSRPATEPPAMATPTAHLAPGDTPTDSLVYAVIAGRARRKGAMGLFLPALPRIPAFPHPGGTATPGRPGRDPGRGAAQGPVQFEGP